ncbi:MAG: tetratricopeptide repeat protein [Caulobacteraceae bacterium]|nr:tetratricopeptide repeat protein [Caulobacteraceae bacterium]
MAERSAHPDAADLESRRAAAAAAPDRPELAFRLAAALAREGRNEEALRVLEGIDKGAAEPAWVFQRGLAHFRLGQWPEAEAAFRRAFAAEPDRADWTAWRARALLAAGDLGAAGEALESAVALEPGKAAFALLLARTYLREGRVEDAGRVVEAGVAALQADDPLGERLLAMRPMVRLAEARRHALQGVLELRATHWRRAVKAFDRALRLVPDQPPWRVLRGRALLGGKDLAGAKAELERAAGEDPRPGTFALLSNVQQQLGDAAAALRSAEQAVALDPEGPAWRVKRAGLRLQSGDAPGAVADYREALARAPGHAAWSLGLVRSLLKAGDPGSARALLVELAGRPGAAAATIFLLGTVETQLGDNVAAVSAWRRAIAAAGAAARPAWRARLAGVLAGQGYELDALAELEAAVAGRDATPAIRAQLAQLYWRLAEAPKALAQIERAIAEDPAPPFKWTIMADEIRGRLAGGEETHSRAVSAEYADAFYRSSKVQAGPASQSPYYGFWQEVARAVGRTGARAILDLGCGPGQFAEFLTGSLPDVRYAGVDFSRVAIEQGTARVPGATFRVGDLSDPEALAGIDYDLVTALEVLEHIEDDLAVFGRLIRGKRFVGSVPNFDSFGHVRFFRDEEAVRARYGPVVDALEIEPFRLSSQAILFLMSGVVA